MKKIIAIILFLFISLLIKAQINFIAIDSLKISKIVETNSPSFYILPLQKLPNYYIPTLGVFCKAELQLQKQITIPIKFRLGTLQYCNIYEGKH